MTISYFEFTFCLKNVSVYYFEQPHLGVYDY
jgi:hypothetical protein